MGIIYEEERGKWKLDTPHTSYTIGIADKQYIGHNNYGARIRD